MKIFVVVLKGEKQQQQKITKFRDTAKIFALFSKTPCAHVWDEHKRHYTFNSHSIQSVQFFLKLTKLS